MVCSWLKKKIAQGIPKTLLFSGLASSMPFSNDTAQSHHTGVVKKRVLFLFLLGRRTRLRFVSRKNEQNKTSNVTVLLVTAHHVLKWALHISPYQQVQLSFSTWVRPLWKGHVCCNPGLLSQISPNWLLPPVEAKYTRWQLCNYNYFTDV